MVWVDAVRGAMVSLMCTVMLASSVFARDGTLDLIDTLRTRDCTHPLSSAEELRPDGGLDAAASEVMKGRKMDDALRRAEFRATRSAVIHVSGAVDELLSSACCGKAIAGRSQTRD